MKRPSFHRNEYLEILSRIKADQPKRYAREVSAGQQVRVSNYERWRELSEQQSARAGERSRTDEQRAMQREGKGAKAGRAAQR